MATTTDAELRVLAENDLDAANTMMGQPASGPSVSGEWWSDFAARAKKALELATVGPPMKVGKIGGKIRDAVKRGLEAGSDASDTAKTALKAVAIAASLAAMAPFLLFALIAFAAEKSGAGPAARQRGRAYLRDRYGF